MDGGLGKWDQVVGQWVMDLGIMVWAVLRVFDYQVFGWPDKKFNKTEPRTDKQVMKNLKPTPDKLKIRPNK